jgi:hypothetical protein
LDFNPILTIFAALIFKVNWQDNETHIPTFEEKKKEQARFPRTHGVS